jgi:hypothetical protein
LGEFPAMIAINIIFQKDVKIGEKRSAWAGMLMRLEVPMSCDLQIPWRARRYGGEIGDTARTSGTRQ